MDGIWRILTIQKISMEEKNILQPSLKKDWKKPEIYGIPERFSWEPSDMESIMFDVQNGMTDKDAAQKWIDTHPEKIQEWLNSLIFFWHRLIFPVYHYWNII